MKLSPRLSPRLHAQSASSPDDVELGDARFGPHRHVCAFFHSAAEEYGLLLPFIKDGLARGERAFHIVDPELRASHVERIESVGIDGAASQRSGQLVLRNWADAYLLDGHFDQYKMLSLIGEALDAGPREGYARTRLIAHMEWALTDRPGVEDLVEYETRLNHLLPRYQDPVICTYDLAKFGGDIVIDIMRTHPMVIIGGQLQENPFFVQPDDFLHELRRRGSTGRPSSPPPS